MQPALYVHNVQQQPKSNRKLTKKRKIASVTLRCAKLETVAALHKKHKLDRGNQDRTKKTKE